MHRRLSPGAALHAYAAPAAPHVALCSPSCRDVRCTARQLHVKGEGCCWLQCACTVADMGLHRIHSLSLAADPVSKIYMLVLASSAHPSCRLACITWRASALHVNQLGRAAAAEHQPSHWRTSGLHEPQGGSFGSASYCGDNPWPAAPCVIMKDD